MSVKRYLAFISYSHKDSKLATRLHEDLERFKVPSSLVGTLGRSGVIPKRLFPVFRDRDELPTSEDLGTNIRSALEGSSYLIVIASPCSAKSKWVDAEVRYFKQIKNNANVLVCIVAGVPNGSDDGANENECFCPSLRCMVDANGALTSKRCEPIAADIREGADGFRRSVIKLAAGMLGVSFDDLFNRERRRRRRLALSVAAVSAVVVLAFVGIYLRVIAVQASQSKLSERLDYLRGDGALREFGSLSGARKADFDKFLVDIKLEERVSAVMVERAEIIKRSQERTVQLRRLVAEARTLHPETFNDGDKSFVSLYNLWATSVEKEAKKMEAIQKSGYSFVGLVSKTLEGLRRDSASFPKNMEEELVLEKLLISLDEKLRALESDVLSAVAWDHFEDISALLNPVFKEPDFPLGNAALMAVIEGERRPLGERVHASAKTSLDLIASVKSENFKDRAHFDSVVGKINDGLFEYKRRRAADLGYCKTLSSFNVSKDLVILPYAFPDFFIDSVGKICADELASNDRLSESLVRALEDLRANFDETYPSWPHNFESIY